MLQQDATAWQFDVLHRLGGKTLNGAPVEENVYDASGARTRRNDRVYVRWINGEVLAEYSLAPGGGPATLRRQHILGGADALATVVTAASPAEPPVGVYWFSYDTLRSVRLVTDQAGDAVARFDYSPFGLVLPRTGSAGVYGSLAGFASHTRGEGYDGQDYMLARHYGTDLGRFLSPDQDAPAGDADGWNRYAYAAGNPLKYIDPLGFKNTAEFWRIGPDSVDLTIIGPGGWDAGPGFQSFLWYVGTRGAMGGWSWDGQIGGGWESRESERDALIRLNWNYYKFRPTSALYFWDPLTRCANYEATMETAMGDIFATGDIRYWGFGGVEWRAPSPSVPVATHTANVLFALECPDDVSLWIIVDSFPGVSVLASPSHMTTVGSFSDWSGSGQRGFIGGYYQFQPNERYERGGIRLGEWFQYDPDP
jgi:RHS repeat-associated protein